MHRAHLKISSGRFRSETVFIPVPSLLFSAPLREGIFFCTGRFRSETVFIPEEIKYALPEVLPSGGSPP